MDRSRHTVTEYLNDGKTHSAINIKPSKRFNFITDHFYEVEFVRSKIEHREPITVCFFILQYAQLRMLALYYNFFKTFCDTEKYEEFEMDTDSITESQDCLKKKSGVPKCSACVAKPIVATIESVTSTNSIARNSKKELWKTVEMDPRCQCIQKC